VIFVVSLNSFFEPAIEHHRAGKLAQITKILNYSNSGLVSQSNAVTNKQGISRTGD